MVRALLHRIVVLALTCSAVPVSAATYSAGPGATCTHTTVQAALDAAAANPGADTVRIVRSATWTAQQISTTTDQDVDIIGGYLACTSAAPDGKTTLSGAGGNARSVIALRGNGVFRLRNLVIRDGDQAGDDDGGGIHFVGGGVVDIADSEILENSAEDGGGIWAQGTTITAELLIGANVLISFNTARRNGGGVVAKSLEMAMLEPGSVLLMNTAGGSGGGLAVISGTLNAYAYVGTSGLGDLGAINGNRAANGGGVAVIGGEDSGRDAVLRVFSRDAARPQRIRGNQATVRGGGIDVQPDGDVTSGDAFARVELRHVAIEENSAPAGAAVYLSTDDSYIGGPIATGGSITINADSAIHPDAASCPLDAPCGYIRENDTLNTTGAVIQVEDDAGFYASRVLVNDNRGGWLFYVAGEEYTALDLDNSVLTRNTVQNALIRDDQNQDNGFSLVRLNYLSITDNTIGANGVLSMNEDMDLTRSIIDQPGKLLIATNVGTIGGVHTMEQNVVSVTPLPAGAVYGPPRFVDALRDDYTPRAGSRAADFASPSQGFGFDLYSRSRNVDLIGNPQEFGVADAGAIERQQLDPLVRNGEFDIDVRPWNIAPANWDPAQDWTSDPDSGSAKVIYEPSIGGGRGAAPIAPNSQCIHLPGPGTYKLNGSGRLSSAAAGNRARLRWELRRFGGLFGCEEGTPDLTGIHVLATGTTWTRPALASEIVVSEAEWNVNTSFTIQLDVLGGPSGTTTGWFDSVKLVKTENAPTSNANAANIVTTAGPLVPAFTADTLDYAVGTQDASASIRVDAQVQSAAITVNDVLVTSGVASAPIALEFGPNDVTIRITAPDGVTMKTYFLTITRSGGGSSLFADGFEG